MIRLLTRNEAEHEGKMNKSYLELVEKKNFFHYLFDSLSMCLSIVQSEIGKRALCFQNMLMRIAKVVQRPFN